MSGVKKGFTIVELLITVAVVGILATVSIVSYGNVQRRAAVASLDTSLSQVAEQIELYQMKNGVYPGNLSAVSRTDNPAITYNYVGSDEGYCLDAQQRGQQRVIGTGGRYPGPGDCHSSGIVWTMPANGAVTYDRSSGEIRLNPSLAGSASSPLFDTQGKNSIRISVEVFATQPAPNYTPDTTAHLSSRYFASNGTTPVQNTTGHTGSGYACRAAVNQWKTCTWTTATGPAVAKASFTINSSPTSYTSNNIYRNIRVEVP